MHLKIKAGATGATTKVWVDGKRLGRCTRISYDVKAGGIAQVVMEMWPEKVEIQGEIGKFRYTEKKLKPGQKRARR